MKPFLLTAACVLVLAGSVSAALLPAPEPEVAPLTRAFVPCSGLEQHKLSVALEDSMTDVKVRRTLSHEHYREIRGYSLLEPVKGQVQGAWVSLHAPGAIGGLTPLAASVSLCDGECQGKRWALDFGKLSASDIELLTQAVGQLDPQSDESKPIAGTPRVVIDEIGSTKLECVTG